LTAIAGAVPALLRFWEAAKNKHDPRNHTKPHEIDVLVRGTSCDFVDRFSVSVIFFIPFLAVGAIGNASWQARLPN
jgi:hypothetical protein